MCITFFPLAFYTFYNTKGSNINLTLNVLQMKGYHKLAKWLLILGGLNLLLLGSVGWDVSQVLDGADGTMTRIAYVVVGLAALYELAMMHGKK